MTHLFELCAGSAALTRYLCGCSKLVGYMGSKDRYIKQIIDVWQLPQPDIFCLNDPGFWGIIWAAIVDGRAAHMAKVIDAWYLCDPKCLFEHLRKTKDTGNLSYKAAARLCLLASTYGGGEIGGFKGKHKLRPSVDGFIPSRVTLANRVKNFKIEHNITVTNQSAVAIEPVPKSFAYIDPPYNGTSGYENKLVREQVLEIATRWKSVGCSVAISEAVPLDEVLGGDWKSVELMTTAGQVRKNSRTKTEFLTFC